MTSECSTCPCLQRRVTSAKPRRSRQTTVTPPQQQHSVPSQQHAFTRTTDLSSWTTLAHVRWNRIQQPAATVKHRILSYRSACDGIKLPFEFVAPRFALRRWWTVNEVDGERFQLFQSVLSGPLLVRSLLLIVNVLYYAQPRTYSTRVHVLPSIYSFTYQRIITTA